MSYVLASEHGRAGRFYLSAIKPPTMTATIDRAITFENLYAATRIATQVNASQISNDLGAKFFALPVDFV